MRNITYRLQSHFKEAPVNNESDIYIVGCDTNLILKHATEGFNTLTFAIEALFIKFVFGIDLLTNIQPGHYSGLFRAKNDWQKRIGFDLPFVINSGSRVDRQDKLDLMIGEGLDVPLMEIQDAFPNLVFDAPKILDASELGIEADFGNIDNQSGARIKIFIRRKKIQIELRPRTKLQIKWMKQHFSKLEVYPLRRADNVFFPDKWRGSKIGTQDIVL